MREAQLGELGAEIRQAVIALARTLLDARRAADRLRAIEEQQELIAGPQAERLGAAWAATIVTGDAHHEPHLTHWLRYVQAQGYDVAKEID